MILTFDLGTTRLKVAVFTLDGQLLGQIAIRNIEYDNEEHRWQSADDWWNHCIQATGKLLNQHNIDPTGIVGCSLSGRAGAGIFLDATGRVLIDPWSDSRHTSQLRSVVKGRDRQEVAMYGATLISKYLWARDNRPELAERTRYLLYAKDFIGYRLTGEAFTDPSSGPDALAWDENLLAEFQVPLGILPRPALPWQTGGHLTTRTASELGLKAGIPVAVGAHDGICANAGAGAVSEGQFAITLGTHAVVRAVASTTPEGSLRFYGLPPYQHIIGGNALMAGRSLDWFIDNWFDPAEDNRQQLFADLDRQAAMISPGANGILFLPFLAGQIAPERRTGARAGFHGLALDSTRPAMYRAVMEGASFALARVFEQVVGWVGAPTYIGVTGSGANSGLWTQIIADLVQQPLKLSDAASEGRGAAMFCAMALNYYSSMSEAVSGMIRVSREVEPDPSTDYRAIQERWLSFYEATRPLDGKAQY